MGLNKLGSEVRVFFDEGNSNKESSLMNTGLGVSKNEDSYVDEDGRSSSEGGV